MAAIVPKKDAPGVDICGVDEYYYIVRSDINCYMCSTNFNTGENLKIYSLHPVCSNGDHYLADQDGLFYIIKGTSFRRMTNINNDEGAIVYPLHPSCQDGDHYLAAFGKFYIIYQNKGVYRQTKDMNTYEDGAESSLHPDCKDGLYYFGVKSCYYFMKPHREWGIQYCRCTNFDTNEGGETLSFHPSVINFLLGGLGITRGPSAGVWNCIKTIKNESETTITCENKISITHGFEKAKMSSIEHNWNISTSTSMETGAMSTLITKSQVSLPPSYGGSSIITELEDWTETTVMEETISLQLQPNQVVYIWQYQLSLGSEAVLFCRELRFQDDPIPPTTGPFSH